MITNIPLEEISYILGFLQGDGHHAEYSRNRGKVSIEISAKDVNILDKIDNVLSKEYTVTRTDRTRDTNFKKDYSAVSLNVFDGGFRDAIKPYVPVGKKSANIEPIRWASERDYLRGLYDSDGSIGITSDNKPFISLCTSSDSIKDFLISVIFNVTGAIKGINRNARDGAYNIMLLSEDAQVFSKFIYDGSSIYLDRKFDKYLEVQSWVRTTKKRVGRSKRWTPEEDAYVLDDNVNLETKMSKLDRSRSSIDMRLRRLNGLIRR